MGLLFAALGAIAGLVALVSWIFILIAAFRDEIWKGLLCLICGIYALYYAITEYDNLFVNQIPVGLVYIVATVLSAGFSYLIRFAR